MITTESGDEFIFMEYRTDVRETGAEIKRSKRLPAAFLLLTAAILFSCSHKGQDALAPSASPPSSPGTAPVVQLSPDTSATVIPNASPDRKLFKSGEVVPAGYLGYKVNGSWFTDHLPTQDGARKSPLSYLYVDLNMVNTDKKERPVGPFKLIDEKGRESLLSERASAVEQSVGQIGKLGPSVSKRAFAIFEVRSGHQYQLKIPGFSDKDALLIELSPAAAPPAK